MPPVLRAFDFVENYRESAERLRQQELQQSVLGLVRANMIEANAIRLGIDGNVAVSTGALSLNDPDSLVDIPAGSFTVGDAATLITIPPGAISAGGNPAIAQALIPTSGITNTLLAPDSVTTSKVSANAIGANEIAANAIIAGKIAAGAVVTSKLDAGAVTADKIDVTRLDLISKAYKSDTAVPRIELSANGMEFWSEQALPGDSPTNNCPTWRYTDTTDAPFDVSVGQLRGNHPIVGGNQAHSMELVTFGGGHAAFGSISTKMTYRNLSGTELAYVKIFADGNGHVSGDWIGDSDRKLKEKIEPVDGALAKVRKLKPRAYTRKKSGRREHGLIAQEVEGIVPEAVREHILQHGIGGDIREETVKGVSYNQISALTLAALQELSDEVDKLKAKK